MAIPGSIVLANRGEYFSCRHPDSSGMRRLVVWFSDNFLEEVAQDFDRADARMQAGVLPPGKSAAKMFGWMRKLAMQGPGREDTAYALAATALTAARADPSPIQASSRHHRCLRSVMRYIETSYAEPCSLKTLAALAGLSRCYFVRAFRAVAGVSPNQYLINTRLRAAADRLLTTKAPVAEIAFGVGFNDISHFNACFRVAFGCSPRMLRAGS
jgi:AraC-like DNA-binding protein